MPVVARRFQEALPATPFLAPDARERGVKGKLHLILQGEISSRKPRQQFRQVGGKLTPQISFDQVPGG